MSRDDADILLIGYGNPGRLDDGLGPAFATAVEALGLPGVAVEADYQLSVEDAAELAGPRVVVFADADATGPEPFSVRRIQPGAVTLSFSSHSVEPGAVLALARQLFGAEPEAWLLGIRGCAFDAFGEQLSEGAKANLDAAVRWFEAAARGGTFQEVRPDGGDDPHPQTENRRRGPAMQDGKKTILCIDDDPDVRMFCKTVLEANDYVMLEAGTAEEGLRVYREHEVDCIIVDLMMEEIDAGTSFVKELKALGNIVPIYMLSAIGDDLAMAADYSDLGFAGVFQKPVDPGHLIAVLASKLGD